MGAFCSLWPSWPCLSRPSTRFAMSDILHRGGVDARHKAGHDCGACQAASPRPPCRYHRTPSFNAEDVRNPPAGPGPRGSRSSCCRRGGPGSPPRPCRPSALIGRHNGRVIRMRGREPRIFPDCPKPDGPDPADDPAVGVDQFRVLARRHEWRNGTRYRRSGRLRRPARTAGSAAFHLRRQSLERPLPIGLQCDAERADFKDLAQFQDAVQLLGVVAEHVAALLGLDLNQPLGLQAQQRIAHRRPADAELLGEARFRQLLAELQPVRDDQFADLIRGERGQGARAPDAIDDRRARRLDSCSSLHPLKCPPSHRPKPSRLRVYHTVCYATEQPSR